MEFAINSSSVYVIGHWAATRKCLPPLRALQRAMATNNSCRYVLGIETSCDDTGAAIVDDSGNIISEALSSQLRIHLRNGGIIPPVARDLHKEKIESVVEECLTKSKLDISQIEAVAVTNRPGMPMSLLVGLGYAKVIAEKWKKPLIPIHHMEAHALTIRMVEDIPFPFMTMLISGGHSLIGMAEDIDKWRLFGTTLDDAPGECMDKTARQLRLINLPQYESMSGGAAIEHFAQFGDRSFFEFPVAMSMYRDCDTSFSGLKWKAKKHIMDEEKKHEIEPGQVIPTAAHLCASFQHAIARQLCKKLERALVYANEKDLLPSDGKRFVVSGGVACNGYIREMLTYICHRNGYELHAPPPKLCCDNGVMIAWNGMEKLKRGLDLTYEYDKVDMHPDEPFGVDERAEVAKANIIVGYIKFPQSGWTKKLQNNRENEEDQQENISAAV